VREVLEKIEEGTPIDYITLGGSGEPLLNSEIGTVIDNLKSAAEIPVTVLTNGSMLMLETVRTEVSAADIVLPSFDAPNAECFQQINRPCSEIAFEAMAEGLVEFRKKYRGLIWLEIFLVDQLNTTEAAIRGFQYWMERIRPDRIHLNTAVRPTAEPGVVRPPDECLVQIRERLGKRAEIVVPYQGEGAGPRGKTLREDLLRLLQRRPCTLADMEGALHAHSHELLKYLEPLVAEGEIETVRRESETYYRKPQTARLPESS
jgi:wyosine [tRNA(Phe)-imidazoG37] synthetase (radical SAM superfamily)